MKRFGYWLQNHFPYVTFVFFMADLGWICAQSLTRVKWLDVDRDQ